MSISGVGGNYYMPPAATNKPSGAGAAGDASLSSAPAKGGDAVTDFLNYMKETPAQRMEDKWLKAHGLTREALAKMSPAEQKAVMEAMRQDIERQMKQQVEGELYKKTDILA